MKHRNTLRFSRLLSWPDNLSLSVSLSLLSVGDNARQFLRRLLPRRRTMDLPAAPQASPSFSSIRPSAILFFSFFFLFLRPRRRDPFSPSFRDVFLALRLAASLFPTLSPGEDSSIRAQPLAYNETENLSGTRGMRHMITYIETKNRPARRSAALSLFPSFSLVLLFVSSFAFRKHRDTSISRSEQSQRESDSTIKYCLK